MILSVENVVEIKLFQLPLEVKLTFKSVVLAKIALNMAHNYDVIVTSWGAFMGGIYNNTRILRFVCAHKRPLFYSDKLDFWYSYHSTGNEQLYKF